MSIDGSAHTLAFIGSKASPLQQCAHNETGVDQQHGLPAGVAAGPPAVEGSLEGRRANMRKYTVQLRCPSHQICCHALICVVYAAGAAFHLEICGLPVLPADSKKRTVSYIGGVQLVRQGPTYPAEL